MAERLTMLSENAESEQSNREQYLFSLEFFIHQITGERLYKLNQMFNVPTTVTISFLNLDYGDPVEITPVDTMFLPRAGIPGDSEKFFTGKSAIFAIPQNMVINKNTDFKIKMTVRKIFPEEIRPHILVGSGELDMSQEFAGLRKEILQCWHRDDPPPKVFEGPVELEYMGKPSGIAEIFARISAYGQSIVTEIEAPALNKSGSTYVFRSDERNDKSLAYKCRIISPSKMDICRESKDDLTKSPCNVCVPKSTSCYPCGQLGGAEVRKSSEPIRRENHGLPDGNDTFRGFGDTDGKGIIRSSRGNPEPCGRAVVLKVSGLLDVDGNKKPTVTVDSKTSKPDEDYDFFVLRIGKKGLVGPDEKSDIELEMRTPKGPERRPPIRFETREMQTEEDVKAAKGKNAKGKNNKKKKK